MKRSKIRFLTTSAIVVAVCLLLVGLIALVNRHPQMVGLNQEIQYDDFAFSVLNIRKESIIAGARPQGIFCMVTMRVANHALRVDYAFKKNSVILIDDEGNEFHPSIEGQKALEDGLRHDELCAEPIPAGADCVTRIVFDAPRTARISQLRISEGGQIGDVLDSIFYGRKRIAIPPAE